MPDGEIGGADDLVVLDTEGKPCTRDEAGRFSWPGGQPPVVAVRVDDGPVTFVPVLDPYGRLAALELDPIGIDDAIDMLLRFPESAALDEPESGAGGDPEGEDGLGRDELGAADALSTADADRTSTVRTRDEARRLMRLIEAIADRQTLVHEVDWPVWCVRLESVLSQLALPANPATNPAAKAVPAMIDASVAFARLVGVNPLAPLRHGPFRPDFALEGDPAALLDRTLDAVEARWGVAELEPLGGQA